MKGCFVRETHRVKIEPPDRPTVEIDSHGRVCLATDAPGGSFWPRGIGQIIDASKSEQEAEDRLRVAFGQ